MMRIKNGAPVDCTLAQRLVSEQRDGRDIGALSADLAAHMAGCSRCRQAGEEFEVVGKMLSEWADSAPHSMIARQALRAAQSGSSPSARPRWIAAAAAVTAAACGLVIFSTWRMASPEHGKTGARQKDVIQPYPGNNGLAIRTPVGGATRRGGRSAQVAVGPDEKLAGGAVINMDKPVDDLAYIHSGAAEALRLWTRLPEDVALSIQREADRTQRRGDSFVAVPFPRLAGMTPGAIEAAKRMYEQEKQVVDPRLARKTTLAAKGMPFSDLCKDWSEKTGIEFTAAKSTADDKVTIFCKDQPLRDIMRQITQVFGFLWRRTGEEGKYQYELYQDMRAQLVEEELRNRDRNEALVMLDKEMQRYAKFADLTPDQAREKAENASPEDKALLDNLSGPGWAAAHLYGSLTPDQMTALRNGGQLEFSSRPDGDQSPLPAEMSQGVLHSMHDASIRVDEQGRVRGLSIHRREPGALPDPGRRPADFPNARTKASVKLDFNELGQISLQGSAGFFISNDDNNPDSGGLGGSDDSAVAAGISPSVRDPKNGEANAKQAADPALKQRTSVEPKSSATLTAERYQRNAPTGPHATSADVWAAIHESTGMPVVADYYTKFYAPDELVVKNVPAFDALNKLCDKMRVRWSKSEGWLRFRSTSFFNDRLKEIPHRLLMRWSESRKRNGSLTREDLMEIAQLTDAQLNAQASEAGARALYGLSEWRLAANPSVRPGWRFLAALSPQQREAAWSEKGLPFRQVPLSLQQKFAELVIPNARDRARATAEDVSAATIRVALEDPKIAPPKPAGTKTPVVGFQSEQLDVKFFYRYGGGALDPTRREVGSMGSVSGPDMERVEQLRRK